MFEKYVMFKSIKKLFIKPRLESEAFEAYFNKLPDNLEVSWFRDGNFIIGNIRSDGYEFMTQGKSAQEFIDMVNNAVFSVYEIPEEYSELILKNKKYIPHQEEFAKLNNAAVKKSVFQSQKFLQSA